jgi:RNA polymerase sigma-70 factor (ECF subfamily)
MLLGHARSRMLRPGGQAILLHTVRGTRGLRLPVTQKRESARMDTTTVWRELHDPLLGFITRRVPSADADDVLQDVMLRIHRHEDELDHVERVTGWVYRITTNAITDYYRRSVRREHPVGSGLRPEDNETASVGPDASATDPRAELAGCLQPMIDRLPEKYRQAILLTEYQGMTQTAAAAVLGLSVSGAKTRTQRARMQLKQALTDCCIIELDRRATVTGFHPRDDQCAGCG